MTNSHHDNTGATDFEFDLATPLFDQIRECLERVVPAPLTEDWLDQIEDRPGVYVLHLHGEPVYVGKADESVATRLRKHHRAIAGRQNIEPANVQFKCVYLAITWDPFKPETSLMDQYGTNRGSGWNTKGFGANDPGRNRDQTNLRPDHWHRRFPLDPDWRCQSVASGEYRADQLLQQIVNDVPYWFRYDKTDAAMEEYRQLTVNVPRPGMTTRELVWLVASQLGEAWQATITPSHILLYRERDVQYPEMQVIWPD